GRTPGPERSHCPVHVRPDASRRHQLRWSHRRDRTRRHGPRRHHRARGARESHSSLPASAGAAMTRKHVLTQALSGLVAVLVLLSSVSVKAQSDLVGQWTTLTTLPIVPVHDHLLPSGQVMIWPSGNDPRLWNPANQSVTLLAKAAWNIFCSGHAFLPPRPL